VTNLVAKETDGKVRDEINAFIDDYINNIYKEFKIKLENFRNKKTDVNFFN
jgi:hypothetical protein